MLTSPKTQRLAQATPRSLERRRSASAHERHLFRARPVARNRTLDKRPPVIGLESETQVLLEATAPPDRQRRCFGRPPTGSRCETNSLSEARALREARGRYLPNPRVVPETSTRYFPNPRGVPKAQGRYFLQPSGVQKVSTLGFSDLGQSHEARCGCFGQFQRARAQRLARVVGGIRSTVPQHAAQPRHTVMAPGDDGRCGKDGSKPPRAASATHRGRVWSRFEMQRPGGFGPESQPT